MLRQFFVEELLGQFFLLRFIAFTTNENVFRHGIVDRVGDGVDLRLFEVVLSGQIELFGEKASNRAQLRQFRAVVLEHGHLTEWHLDLARRPFALLETNVFEFLSSGDEY